MRSSTMMVGMLFLLAVGFLILNLWLQPTIETLITSYAEESVPHAIIPEHIREKWDKEGWPKEVKRH